MSWFQLAPQQIADRVKAAGEMTPVPSLVESILRGVLGFAVVSVVGFAPWALGGRSFHHAVGETGLYATCAFVFIGLSGLCLHRLIIGPGSLVRFYLVFTVAFGAYASCWTVGWMSLRGNLGSVVGLLLGTSVMAWVFVRAFDASAVFLEIAATLFVLNALGYFAGGWSEGVIAHWGTIHVLGHSLNRHATLAVAMLTWGLCYGLGLGTGLGLAFCWCQEQARALLGSHGKRPRV